MNQNIWHKLLSLENRDIVQKWFKIINGRTLNASRTKEINAAAKQSREYFKNADKADYSVRPLLAYYGVLSLARTITLLFTVKGGEESLNTGHGLATVNWRNRLSGSKSNGLDEIISLEVETTKGLLTDFMRATKNFIPLHTQSSGVDWGLNYPIPEIGEKFSLLEVLSRFPDLKSDLAKFTSEINFSSIGSINYSKEKGFSSMITNPTNNILEAYEGLGYTIKQENEKSYQCTCNSDVMNRNPPLFAHSFIHRSFNVIPNIHILKPFADKGYYSQPVLTFILSYYLGMISRYFPTQWISLINGEKGDIIWPALYKAQYFIENSFPEQVSDLIDKILFDSESRPE